MNPRFLNLITHDRDRRMYSLHCLDPLKLLFYPSSTQARDAAQDPKTKKKKPSIIQRLPKPAMSFHSWPDTVYCPRKDSSLLGRHGIVFAPYSSSPALTAAALYDTARGVFAAIPPTNSRKEHPLGMTFPVIQDATEDDDPSLYVLDLSGGTKIDTCFEVLARHNGPWSWRTLPGPPFFSHGGPSSFLRPTIQTCSYAAVDDGSTICISTMEQGIGTYAFDTASHVWRKLGQWALPFHGKAEYVPELKLWLGLGLLADYPRPSPRLCVFDLSAMDAERPPTLQHAWDYLDLCSQSSEGGDDNKYPLIHGLHLVNLGSGKFCVATHIRIMWSPPCTSGDDDLSTTDSSSCNSDPEIPMMDIFTEEYLVSCLNCSQGGEMRQLRWSSHDQAQV